MAGKKQNDKNGAKAGTNGGSAPAAATGQTTPQVPTQLDPEVAKKIAEMRSQVRENFGKVVMAMMMQPRYRGQTLDDLQHLVLEPLLRDRIAIAYPADAESSPLADLAGLAIWASVSEEVDAKIRDQIKAGAFPIRLKAEEWNSGSINWLLDVIAPDQRATAKVIANFKQVVKEGALRLHPVITRLVDEETLQKMGASKMNAPAPEPEPAEA